MVFLLGVERDFLQLGSDRQVGRRLVPERAALRRNDGAAAEQQLPQKKKARREAGSPVTCEYQMAYFL